MGFSYKPLLRLLLERNIKKTDLRTEVGLSTATLAKLSKGEPLSGESIEKLCLYFRCQISDLVEYVFTDVPAKPADTAEPALSAQPKRVRKRKPACRSAQIRRPGKS